MGIKLEELLILCELYDAVPVRTPKRVVVIYGFASKILENSKLNGREILIDVHDENIYQNTSFE